MYRISAIIEKDGGLPVEWVHISKVKKTEQECRKYFQRENAGGGSYNFHIKLLNFKCERI